MADTLPPLPCPFCGNDDIEALEQEGQHYVFCIGCGLEAQFHNTRVEAIEAWNRRAALAAVPAQPVAWLCSLMMEDGTTRTQIVEQDPAGLRWNDAGEPSPYKVQPLYAAPQADELAKANDARRQAQAESAELKERMARVRIDLMRELKEQGWAAPQAAPAGWVLVPVEPTQEMCAAAVKFANGNAVYKNVAAEALKIEEAIYGEAYAAMLAAAPKESK